MASNANTCDLCGGIYPDGCRATCPRHDGFQRRDVQRLLERGNIVTGLTPTTRLVGEAINKLERRQAALIQTLHELQERTKRIRVDLTIAEDNLARVGARIDTLRQFEQAGSPSPLPRGSFYQQQQSEPDAPTDDADVRHDS